MRDEGVCGARTLAHNGHRASGARGVMWGLGYLQLWKHAPADLPHGGVVVNLIHGFDRATRLRPTVDGCRRLVVRPRVGVAVVARVVRGRRRLVVVARRRALMVPWARAGSWASLGERVVWMVLMVEVLARGVREAKEPRA